MNIGIDVSPAINQKAGIARYTYQLVSSLLELDKSNNYLLYAFSSKSKQDVFKSERAQFRPHKWQPQLLKTYFLLLRLLNLSADSFTKEADIVHSTDFVLPVSKSKPSIITIHDLAFRHFPTFYTWKNRTYMNSMAKFSAKRADKIIAVSQATKNDIIHFLNVDEKKIIIIPEGVDELFKPSSEQKIKTVKKEYGLPDEYIVTLGTLQPRKNLEALIDAFARLRKDKAIPHKLVVVGEEGWNNERLLTKLDRLDIAEDIVITGFIEDNQLPSLYSGATALVYPSLYEGFGLPVLEAMACGVPVACSNTSSLPEVAGEAALLFDPTDVDQIYSSMQELLSDDRLRNNLSEAGIKRARHFTWEKTAKQTLSLYNTLKN